MPTPWSPIHFERTDGRAPIVLICEHASKLLPADFGDIGLTEEARASHAAWDIGALDVARGLAEALDAPLAHAGVSRLLYDCNRPPTAPDCIPGQSERFEVPGNRDLSRADRAARARLIHDPFHAGVAALIAAHQDRVAGPLTIITVHTFTPVFLGEPRAVQIGFLHDENAALSVAAHEAEAKAGIYASALNEPYAAADGVTYSLARHAEAEGRHSTMIEVRNDLVDTAEAARDMARHLADTLRQSMAKVLPTMESAT